MNENDPVNGLNRRDMLKSLAAVPVLSEAVLSQPVHAQSSTKVDVLIVGSGPRGRHLCAHAGRGRSDQEDPGGLGQEVAAGAV
jgi:hypothetical protein